MSTTRLSPSEAQVANSKRVLWVTRRFWPHASGRHARASASVKFACRLANAGYRIEVLTPRYNSHWSEGFLYEQIPVHRVVAAPKGDWSTQRYVRYLGNWIIEKMSDFDAIICDGISEEVRAVAAAASYARKKPSPNSPLEDNAKGKHAPIVITICDGWGGDADEVWCRQARGGKRALAALTEMDYVVTRHAAADRFLVAHQVPTERIHRISHGFSRPIKVSTEQRLASQKSLAMANSDLVTEMDDRVLLWCGNMEGRPRDNAGVVTLVKNARLLCGRYPNLKIWLLGDGQLHDWVHSELKAEGVRSVVAIPGTFSDMTDIWRAVDYVAITCEDQLRYLLPNAIESAIPVIIADQPTMRAWTRAYFPTQVADSFAWYDPHRIASFRKTFRMLWDDKPTSNEHATEIANDASRSFGDIQEMNQWAEILSPRRMT